LVSRSEADGKIIFELHRALEPCDPQDRPILNNGFPTRIVAAHGGSSKTMSYHQQNRVALNVDFFNDAQDPLLSIKSDASIKTLELRARGEHESDPYQLSSVERTASAEFCFPVDVAGQIVASDALINPDSSQYVHHLVLKGVKGTVGPDCRSVHPLQKHCDAAFEQRHAAAMAACPVFDGMLAGCSDTACYEAIQALQGTDLYCYSTRFPATAWALVGSFVEMLKECDSTGQPFAVDVALTTPCSESIEKRNTAYNLCVEQDCAADCLAHLETITADDVTKCLADYYFQGSAYLTAQWFQTEMYENCGGTGTFTLVEAFPNDASLQVDHIWAWAPDGGPLVLPSDVGIDIGGQGYASIAVQMHYENPSSTEGVTDNSGVTVYYTETPRAQRAGMLQLGDKNGELDQTLVKPEWVTTELVEHTITCPSEATELMLGTSTITISTSLPHMHAAGFWMSTTVFNKTGGLKKEFLVEYYDGGYQRTLDANIEISPGDSFTTRLCSSRSKERCLGVGVMRRCAWIS